MFPTPSFMESNTSAFLVSVTPSGGPLKSSIFFQISLYSFVIVDSLEASLQLFYASPFKSATPSATSHSKAKVRNFSNKQQIHTFFHQKDNLASSGNLFSTASFSLPSAGDGFSTASFLLLSVVGKKYLVVERCAPTVDRKFHAVERCAPTVDKKFHAVERCALVVDKKFHGVERRFCHHLKIPCQLSKVSISPSVIPQMAAYDSSILIFLILFNSLKMLSCENLVMPVKKTKRK